MPFPYTFHTRAERKANTLGQPIETPIFPDPTVPNGDTWNPQDFRWKQFKNMPAEKMYQVITEGVFPFMKQMTGEQTAFAAHMNMLLHGIENPLIQNRDSLSEGRGAVENQYSLILANPPFAGSLDYESTAKDLLTMVKTKKTELLFLALFLRLLKPGGRGHYCAR